MGHTKEHMKCRAKGGRVVYEGAGSNVAKEAVEKNRGGFVGKPGGSKGKHRVKKARGGSCDANPFSSAYRGSENAT